jgi:N-acetylneuraminate synthase
MASVKIGKKNVGDGHPCYLVAEIGINHNGDVALAKKLVRMACDYGWDAVKFQKRTVDVVYTRDELDKPREHPWGTTNGELKRRLELSEAQYREIDAYCREIGIDWFASCWDEGSVDFMRKFDPPAWKIASASLTDDALLKYHRKDDRPVILSTGMSSLEQVDHAVEVLGKRNLVILHAVSTYPAYYQELNLSAMPRLRERYGVPVGYSGHETGLPSSVAAVALGASVIERHITLDRSMWGTDHAASLGPSGVERLARDVRLVEQSRGDGVKKVLEREIPVQKKLRRKG